jgi:choline dehydrogenase-like flavoprotein
VTRPTVAIVGAGITAATLGDALASRGCQVTMFEKGLDYPYPHAPQFRERIDYRYWNSAYFLPEDLDRVTHTGDYPWSLKEERVLVVGGSATRWNAITLRMRPQDFRTATLHGMGHDWPLSYDDLEPYYCRAEARLGVSGTDADNPFAPYRSRPYPLPPFALTRADRLLADRLAQRGIVLHTTPQARTRHPYDGRSACLNFGTCSECPVGARYSPNVHLVAARNAGRCVIRTNVSVRRIVVDEARRARAVVYRENDGGRDVEHPAEVVIVAAGAIESARLLLLSGDADHPKGLGNHAGHVGRGLVFHHLWAGTLHYEDKMFAGRMGPLTGQAHQFLDHETRGRTGAIKVEFSASFAGSMAATDMQPPTAAAALDYRRQMAQRRGIILQAETIARSDRFVTLSKEVDRFGDPFAHVQYKLSDFDAETYTRARSIFHGFASATRGEPVQFDDLGSYESGAHHMGTCRMGLDEGASVVDPFGRVHGVQNLYVIGAANFVGASGAVNPTLTIVALALRAAEHIVDSLRHDYSIT